MRTMPFAALLTAGLMAGAGAAGAQQGDAAAGEKAFGKCKACHTVEAGKNRVGPSLRGVVGRKSGTVEGFKYSDAMKNAAIEWTPENLDKYLADPKGFVPGNKMVFAGIKDPAERANVIAYLQTQGGASTGASAPPDASQQQASPLPGSGPGVGAATGQVAQGPSDAPASGSAVPAQGSPQIAAGDGAGDQVSALPALSAPLKGADGRDLGTVTLTGAEGGVVLEIQASGLKPGEHGFHVHETGACQGDFKSAGGHFNPAGTTHGVLGGKAHAGDLPNLHVPADGKVVAEFFVQGVSLQGGQNALMDQNGAAVVVHAGPDDYRTDPAGNSGDRIACAAFAAAK